MQVVWAPWRMVYIAGQQPPGCIFCPAPELDRRQALIVKECAEGLVMLNRYPYASGHVLVAPWRHVAELTTMAEDEFLGLMRLLQASVRVLEEEFRPEAMNVGMNLGRAAGAGVESHVHWHIVPRWNGDTNFMPVLADVRVIPEHLETTYDRLQPRFAAMTFG